MALEHLQINWADGTTTTVLPLLPDTWKFEEALKNNPRWGGLKDNLMKASQYKAFAALQRIGTDPERTRSWAEFGLLVSNVVTADDDDSAPVDELEVDGLGLDTQTAPYTG